MKKIFTFIAVALVSASMSAEVQRVLIGDLYYNLDTESRTAAVTWEKRIDSLNYHGLKEAIIPASVLYEAQTYAVTAVDSNAFGQCDSLRTIEIPEGVTKIGANGFRQSEHIQSVVIPNSVTEIGDNAFYLCNDMTSLTLGTGLKKVGDHAFGMCKNVKELIIPNNVEYIGLGAFGDFRSATRISIGSGVKHLGNRAFQGCHALPAFEVAEGNTIVCVEDGVLFNLAKDTLLQCPGAKTGDYVAPASVKIIDAGSFYNCQYLRSIKLQEGVTYIGAAAINSCTGLKDFVVPNTVTEIGGTAFAHCVNLESLTLGSSLDTIGQTAFVLCSSLKKVTSYAVRPPKVGAVAFFQVPQADVTLYVPGSSVSKYGTTDTWKDFGTIEPIPMPGIVRTKVDDLYYNIDTTNHVAAVSWDKYYHTTNYRGLTSAVIPEAVTYNGTEYPVTSVDSMAFITCSTIESLVLPNSVTELKYAAFMACDKLQSVTFGTGLKTIGTGAFSGCLTLPEIVIPDHVEYIGGSAFMNCQAATRVYIGSGVKHLADRAFQGVTALPAFEVAAGNTIVCAVDGVLFNMAKDTLIQFPGGKGSEYIVPAGVTAIGDASFYGCENLTAITFPETLAYLGTASFVNCTGLTEVVLPNSVTKIPMAFTHCTGLKHVTIGNAVTEIGLTAFSQCTALETFTCHTVTPPALVSYPFLMNNLAAVTLYVPAEAIEAYKAADTWKDFGTIAAIQTDVEQTAISGQQSAVRKLMLNGQLLILRDGKAYTLTGTEVR